MFSYPQSESISCAFPVIKETLPRSQLGYAANNVYPGFPPMMEDGRSLIASYQPEADLNANLLKSQNIKSNWQYRQYLTNNSESIIKDNFRESCNDVGYFQRLHQTDIIKSKPTTPYKYSSYLDNNNASASANSDLKDMYLSREQLNSRKISPSITQEQIFRGNHQDLGNM